MIGTQNAGKCIKDGKISVVSLIRLFKSIQLGGYKLQPAGFYDYFCMKNPKNSWESPSFKVTKGIGNLDIDLAIYDQFVLWIRTTIRVFSETFWVEETLAELKLYGFTEIDKVSLRIFVDKIKMLIASPEILFCKGDSSIYIRSEKGSAHVQ